jgi:hypothetical protein
MEVSSELQEMHLPLYHILSSHSHYFLLVPTIKMNLINFENNSSGRVDALDPSAVTPDGRLPNADSGPAGADPSDAAHLRTIFNRMGFNDQEIVALSGAHALGRW